MVTNSKGQSLDLGLGISTSPVESTDELVIHAVFQKKTKNYLKYIPQLTEDPPEFLPDTAFYVGNHLAGVKRVVILLEENNEIVK